MTHDVFISHSSHDRDVADAACIALEQRGFRCWIAPSDILPGQDYGEATADAIRASRVFLLIFSAATVDLPQVRREVERAGEPKPADYCRSGSWTCSPAQPRISSSARRTGSTR